jgi:hypothetical protein
MFVGLFFFCPLVSVLTGDGGSEWTKCVQLFPCT